VLTIILAAGKSQRFIDSGYHTPKPFLQVKWQGKTQTVLEHVLDSLPEGLEKALVGVPEGFHHFLENQDRTTYKPWMKSRLKVIENTIGQADTLRQLIDYVPDQKVMVLNSDVLFRKETLDMLSKHINDVTILTQDSNNPSMSYIDKFPWPEKVVEKVVISNHAVSGAWMFAECGPIMGALTQVCKDKSKEPYLSHALNIMKGKKYALKLLYSPIDWGTPESLAASGAEIVRV
jgi:NDP-sugar pyrophosphorylase family protein